MDYHHISFFAEAKSGINFFEHDKVILKVISVPAVSDISDAPNYISYFCHFSLALHIVSSVAHG